MAHETTFDPSAAAMYDGPYGLPHTIDEAKCILVPVPFEATTSYGGGTADGPQAILEASRQVDLYDLEIGRVYEPGIAMIEESAEVRGWNDEARAAAEPVIAAGGAGDDQALQAGLVRANALCGRMNDWVYAQVQGVLSQGKLPAVVGGDHSVPFGAIRAVAEKHPGVGVLHLDAHADLRDAYEGFTWSHASIMHNVVTRIPGVSKLVQVGIRDFAETELAFIRESKGRVVTYFDAHLARERLSGTSFAAQVERIVSGLPKDVYLSYDIDGLDPTLCPNTGTPVPGGLSFHEAAFLTAQVARSGRRIVGIDLNEVAPGPNGEEWNGNVGARLLYKMIGWMFVSQGLLTPPALVAPDPVKRKRSPVKHDRRARKRTAVKVKTARKRGR